MKSDQFTKPKTEDKVANVNDGDGWRWYKPKLDEKCWDTHKQVGMKNKNGKKVPNCIPKESSILNGINKLSEEKIDATQVNENTNDGISQEDLVNSLEYRLMRMYPDIINKYGHEVVADAIMDTAAFYAGATELGTSDVSNMVRSILKNLESRANLIDNVSEDSYRDISESIAGKSYYDLILGKDVKIDTSNVKFKKVYKNNKPYLGFYWNDSNGDSQYQEIAIEDPTDYNDLIYRVKNIIAHVENQIRKQGLKLSENLRKWFDEKWVRFGPDGKIRGACARGDDSEGKPKCLPQSKAHSLGKKGRKYAASKKRREDPNPERSGKAINVSTKKKSNETVEKKLTKHNVLESKNKLFVKKLRTESELKEHAIKFANNISLDGVPVSFYNRHYTVCSTIFAANKKTVTEAAHIKNGKEFISLLKRLDQFDTLDIKVGNSVAIINAQLQGDSLELWGFTNPKTITKIFRDPNDRSIKQFEFNNDPNDVWPRTENAEYQGHYLMYSAFFGDKKSAERAVTMLTLRASGDLSIRNHVKEQAIAEQKCPHCNGPMFSELMINEKKDACYYKVKSRYKVWPSAYASGALVKCRKKGASNWGTGGKKSESVLEGQDSIVDKCASLAAKYFNDAGLQREYDIDEFIKINAGDNLAVDKCASLAAKYFNDAGLQREYDIDEYIKVHALQGVAEAKPSGESTHWRVEQSEATGRYHVITGYQKRKVWSNKLGAVDFVSKDAAQKKADELNQKENVTEGFKNTYNVGDRVNTPIGPGVVTMISNNVNIDGKVKVKLDDPSRAGEDGKYKDEFVFTTNMLKHLPDQGVAESKQPGKSVTDAIQKVLPIAQEIWFHGSRATGSHRRNSDTDILVVIPDDLVGDQYLAVVRILQKLASHFDNYDIQPTKSGTNIHRIAQEEGRLLWSSKQGVAENNLNEIIKMPPTNNSSQGMAIWAYNDALEKKSPVIYQDQNTVLYKANDNLIRYIVLENNKPILYLGLTKFLDGWKSGTVSSEMEARGKGLATQVYLKASDILKTPIYSDTTQTDASRLGIWNKLLQLYPDRVVGYDQTKNKDLPLTMTASEPVVNQNQPIYVDRNKKDADKPVTPQKRYRTRILKLLPKKQGVAEGNDQEFHTGGSKGLPFPGTYEQENNMFKTKGPRRITAMTYESQLDEKWSDKYKRSIDCNNPKGFSQKAHCQGRKKK